VPPGRRGVDHPLSSLANDDEHLTHLNLLAFSHRYTQDYARAWRRDFHHGFIRLHLDQWLVRTHAVPLFDQPVHDLTLVNTFTNIREAKFQCHVDLKRPGRDG
jgi:hypothetical protein